MERGLRGWQQAFKFISNQTYLPKDYIDELNKKADNSFFEQEIDNGFEREERYTVLKNKDIHRFLDPEQKEQLKGILHTINYYRGLKGPVKCVIVEKDWPEYEPVWKMIKDRVNGRVI